METVLKYFIFLIFLSLNAFSQSIDRCSFFSCSGNSIVAGNIQLQSNIGELNIGTFQTSQITLSQGFVQPDSVLMTDVRGNYFMKENIFPNPVIDILNVELNASNQMEFKVEVLDILGKKLLITNPCKNCNFKLEFSSLNSGVYFVRLLSLDNVFIKVVKINKL